jgi:urate oxidase
MTVSILLHGDFDEAYTQADNCQVIPTDTMKNTVYALARQHDTTAIESFAQVLSDHFLEKFPQVQAVEIEIGEKLWRRMRFDNSEHAHSFLAPGGEQHTCDVVATRDTVTLTSGLTGLQVLKTTGSGFSGFARDPLTTLAETDDRIFATTIDASWPCVELDGDWTAVRQLIRSALLDAFANQFSASVQHTLFEMANAAIAVCQAIDVIDIRMPNQHHLLVDLDRLGLDNPHEIFVPVDEPHGMIQATVHRSEDGSPGEPGL